MATSWPPTSPLVWDMEGRVDEDTAHEEGPAAAPLDSDEAVRTVITGALRDSDPERTAAAWERLSRFAASGEVRDLEFTDTLYGALADALIAAVSQPHPHALPILRCFLATARTPEFIWQRFLTVAPPRVAAMAMSGLARVPTNALQAAQEVAHMLYSAVPAQRGQARRALATVATSMLSTAAASASSFAGAGAAVPAVEVKLQRVRAALEVLLSVIQGLRSPLALASAILLRDVLLPMHQPNGMVTDVQPVLAPYHEPLTKCMLQLCSKSDVLLGQALEELVAMFPSARDFNANKTVLLLHELELLLELTSVESFAPHCDVAMLAIAACIASDHARIAERALQMWRNPRVVALTTYPLHSAGVTDRLLPALLRDCKPHWNPTVNSMTGRLLDLLQQSAPDQLAACAARRWGAEKWAAALQEYRDALTRAGGVAAEPTPSVALSALPTALPDVNFYSFVFGRDLGSGSFSTVRYGKLIARGSTLSRWQEFALKEVDVAKAQRGGYEEVVRREVQVMQRLSHPNIARLLGTFMRGDQFLYLVLEYCAGGDLHSLLLRHGSLAPESARFLLAEVTAALRAVHAAGLVYGDLKPENVLLHESGHAKLGDFGAARAVDTLADGCLVEGTPAYLAPEVLRGLAPSPAADMWALGCVMFQLLAGRPPVWGEDEGAAGGEHGALVAKVVRFSGVEDLGLDFPDSFPPAARALVERLLDPEPARRPNCDGVLASEFFAGLDADALHAKPAPRLAAGSVAPEPDKAWNRRKGSVMWAPMPAQYDVQAAPTHLPAIPETDEERESDWVESGMRPPHAL